MNGLLTKKTRETDMGKNAPSLEKSTPPLFHSSVLPILGSLLSGVLLALSFPGFGHSTLIYVGLVPLLFAVRKASAKKAALLGLLAGFV